MKTKVVIEIETNIVGSIVAMTKDTKEEVEDKTNELEEDLHNAIKKAIETTIDIDDDDFASCVYDNELETHPDKIKWEDYGLKVKIETEAPTKKK